MSKIIIPCVCMTCGVRNDFSTENGYCKNGHDNWLEYRDVASQNEWFSMAMEKFNMTEDELTNRFMNPEILKFK